MEATRLLKPLVSFQPKNKKGSFRPEDPGNPTVNHRGEKRSNETHGSKSDPETQLARKGAGKEAKLSYSGNLLVENRNGLIVDSRVWEATGTAERYAGRHRTMARLCLSEGAAPSDFEGAGFDFF